jgi:hypothetical protein
LISPFSDSEHDFNSIVNLAKYTGVDSLRFSIPFANYNQSFDTVREYKRARESMDTIYTMMLGKYLSDKKTDRPYIFYTGPEFTDVEKFKFKQCAYGYYQLTFGADGYTYKCSTVATPTAKHCRLGETPKNMEELKKLIMDNNNPKWDCKKMCFERGLRCNRQAIEINTHVMED